MTVDTAMRLKLIAADYEADAQKTTHKILNSTSRRPQFSFWIESRLS